MAVTITGPVNVAQVIAALPNATPTAGGVTVTPQSDGKFLVTAPAYRDAAIAAACSSITYDSAFQLPQDANRTILQQHAIAALPALLALEGATKARTPQQTNDAITTLAKGLTAVIRLLLDQLDTTSGT